MKFWTTRIQRSSLHTTVGYSVRKLSQNRDTDCIAIYRERENEEYAVRTPYRILKRSTFKLQMRGTEENYEKQ